MNIVRMFKLGIRVAEWATPHVKELHRQKHFNRTEAQRHVDARNWSEAEKHLTEAIQEGHSKKNFIELFIQLARVQAKQGKLTNAADSARAAVDLAHAARNSTLLWEALEVQSDVQAAQGNAAAAVATLESMERSERALKTPDGKRLAVSTRKRGKLLLEGGRVAEAFPLLDQAIQLAENAWGKDNVETGNCLSEIGGLYRQTGVHTKAQECLRRALKIYRNASASDSMEATEGLHNLALSLEESGDIEGAASEYERVISMREMQLGGDRSGLADAQVRLAALYIQSGRISAARELLRNAITVLEMNRGELLRDALEIMAVAEDEAGRPQDAEKWREKAARLAQTEIPVPTRS